MKTSVFKRAMQIIIMSICILTFLSIGLFNQSVISSAAEIATDFNTEYTITYHLDGGTNALKNPDVYTVLDTITLKDATKTGYDFAGWFLDEAKTEQISEISSRTGNLHLYAKFIPKSYDATFDIQGGYSLGNDITITLKASGETRKFVVKSGSTFSPYQEWIPHLQGYHFAGWMYDGKIVSNIITTDVENVELYAKWAELNVGATGLNSQTKFIETDGYTFQTEYSYGGNTRFEKYYASCTFYVYINGEYETINYYGYSYYANYPLWTSGGFSIYDGTRGVYLVNAIGENNDKGKAYATKYHYYRGELTVSPGTLLCITVYTRLETSSEWRDTTAKSYDPGYISLSVGSLTTPVKVVSEQRYISQEYDSTIQTPTTIIKDGYEFIGWYDENDTPITDKWQYLEDKTFYAKWKPISYQISYELNGGENNSANPSVKAP